MQDLLGEEPRGAELRPEHGPVGPLQPQPGAPGDEPAQLLVAGGGAMVSLGIPLPEEAGGGGHARDDGSPVRVAVRNGALVPGRRVVGVAGAE